MKFCKKCVMPNTRPGIYFDKAGVCQACRAEEKSKVYDDHYRRFIRTDKFLNEMQTRDFTINEFYKGTGLSIYKEEDPFLARVFAEKQ